MKVKGTIYCPKCKKQVLIICYADLIGKDKEKLINVCLNKNL